MATDEINELYVRCLGLKLNMRVVYILVVKPESKTPRLTKDLREETDLYCDMLKVDEFLSTYNGTIDEKILANYHNAATAYKKLRLYSMTQAC